MTEHQGPFIVTLVSVDSEGGEIERREGVRLPVLPARGDILDLPPEQSVSCAYGTMRVRGRRITPQGYVIEIASGYLPPGVED